MKVLAFVFGIAVLAVSCGTSDDVTSPGDLPTTSTTAASGLAEMCRRGVEDAFTRDLCDGRRQLVESVPTSDGGACRSEEPPTAGNRVAWFMSDVQQGRDPNITGGVGDPFACACDQLCEEIRSRVSEAQFRVSRGEAVSEALTAETWLGPSAYSDRGLREQYSDMETLDPTIRSASAEATLLWSTMYPESEHREKWRISLVREGENWRVCGFERLGT
jgi:hypothetical protein